MIEEDQSLLPSAPLEIGIGTLQQQNSIEIKSFL